MLVSHELLKDLFLVGNAIAPQLVHIVLDLLAEVLQEVNLVLVAFNGPRGHKDQSLEWILLVVEPKHLLSKEVELMLLLEY